jgi:hypothetical protein
MGLMDEIYLLAVLDQAYAWYEPSIRAHRFSVARWASLILIYII